MLYVGDHYGQLNSVEFFQKKVAEVYGEASKNSPVRHITSNNVGECFFATSKVIYYLPSKRSIESYALDTSAHIVGLSPLQQNVMYSLSDGGIYKLDCTNNQEHTEECVLFEVGVVEGWQKGFLEPIEEASQYCMIGSKIPPIVIDLNKEMISWKAKNVANDELELKVPIGDVDGVFYNNCNNVAVLHKDRKLRLYDIKKGQRRPILSKDYTDEKSNFTKVIESLCGNQFYIGNAQGSVFVCDKRKDLGVCGKFKGANGSLTDMKVIPEHFLVTSSLDSYVRFYDISDNRMLSSYYVGTPLYSISADLTIDDEQLEDFLEAEEERSKLKTKAPKRRNTVQLPYLARKQLKKQEAENATKQENQE